MNSTKIKEEQETARGDALPDKELQNKLYPKLQQAMQLWNVVHEKSKIIFNAGGETKSLDTPVWFVSEKYVCVNAGVILLVSNILEVI